MSSNIFSKLTYPQKIGINVLIFLVLSFVLIYWLIAPAVAAVEATKLQMQNQSEQSAKDYAAGQNLKKLTQNIKAIEPRVGLLEQIFINKNDSSFAPSLEAAAAKNKVTEKTNLGQATPLDQYYDEIPLTLNVEGNFNGIAGFVADLEILPKTINLDSLIITALSSELPAKTSTSSPQKILSGTISASTFWVH